MIDGQTVLGLVVARGGSKGLPRKNVLPLAGKPLIGWTIDAARASVYIDRLVLSTDDDEIAAVAQDLGCEVPFRRPAELATDETGALQVIEHALGEVPGFDLVVLLQPTSPLRSSEDIDGCVDLCARSSVPVVSVVMMDKPAQWMFTMRGDGRLMPLVSGQLPTRRQDAEPLFSLNGAVYVAPVGELGRLGSFLGPSTLAWVMPPERSVDIDTHFDFELASTLLAHKGLR